MCNKGSFTLNACICKRSHFLTVELLPFFPIESLSVRSNESLSASPREHGQKPEVCAHRESFSAGNTCLHKPTPVNRSTDPREVSEYKTGVASTHLIEGYNAGRCYHVDECITHITLILQSCFPHVSLAKTNKLVNKIKIQGLCDFGSNFCIQLKCHIYKHRPHIYLEVNGQIYEIISSTVVFINGCQQHL